MTWDETQIVLRRMGYTGFESEEHYNEWYMELDNLDRKRISKAICDEEEVGLPHFNWNTTYFKINKRSLYGKKSINC